MTTKPAVKDEGLSVGQIEYWRARLTKTSEAGTQAYAQLNTLCDLALKGIEAREWQDISTAPVSGLVLAYKPWLKEPIEICVADGAWWRRAKSRGEPHPIAWQRLPAQPPSHKGEGEARCDTTQTVRLDLPCSCDTYAGNLGPCAAFEAGGNGRCVHCDHARRCHPTQAPRKEGAERPPIFIEGYFTDRINAGDRPDYGLEPGVKRKPSPTSGEVGEVVSRSINEIVGWLREADERNLPMSVWELRLKAAAKLVNYAQDVADARDISRDLIAERDEATADRDRLSHRVEELEGALRETTAFMAEHNLVRLGEKKTLSRARRALNREG